MSMRYTTALRLPKTYRKLVVSTLSTRFRQCTSIETVDMPDVIKPTEVIVRNAYAGVNASDINFTAGTYKPGVAPPFDCGFEAVGTVERVGDAVKGFAVGDAVVSQSFGGFSEYQVVPTRNVKKVPTVDRRWLPLDLSGTTASIALSEVAVPKKGEVALVTAAAGGTGQFAVQLLKHVYGCKVIGTCSSDAKKGLLRSIGCDVAVDYKRENLSEVLDALHPTGVNLVYESVGGPMMDLALKHIAIKGRIVTIGSISGYSDLSSWSTSRSQHTSDKTSSSSGIAPQADGCRGVPIPSMLLMKSASLRGFFLPHYQKFAAEHFARLMQLVDNNTIQSCVDPAPFAGLEQVADAVEYLHGGKNVGKVVVSLLP